MLKKIATFLLLITLVSLSALTVFPQSGGYVSPASGGGGLPSGLGYVAPTLTVSSAGNGNGVLALSGTTSGTATFTAPAVAGTTGNGVTTSNVLYAPDGTTGAPAYSFTNSHNSGFFNNGAGVIVFTSAGTNVASFSATFGLNAIFYTTASNCSSSASPAVCGSAAAGMVAVPVGATPTLTINTTAITANSEIELTVTEAPTVGTRLGVTCNTTLSTLVNPVETARVAGTSFTIQMNSTLVTNPACIHYTLTN